MTEILLIMLGAILIENFIFSRFFGICPFLGVSENPDTAVGMGFAVIFVMTVSCAATSLVYDHLLVRFGLEYLSTIAFIVIIAALVQLIEMFLKKLIPSLYNALGIYLPLITTNCAVLGAALLNVEENRGFIHSVVFGFSAAVGQWHFQAFPRYRYDAVSVQSAAVCNTSILFRNGVCACLFLKGVMI